MINVGIPAKTGNGTSVILTNIRGLEVSTSARPLKSPSLLVNRQNKTHTPSRLHFSPPLCGVQISSEIILERLWYVLGRTVFKRTVGICSVELHSLHKYSVISDFLHEFTFTFRILSHHHSILQHFLSLHNVSDESSRGHRR